MESTPSENVFAEFLKATLSGLKGKFSSNEKKDHFLDYAEDCDEDVVEDRIKMLKYQSSLVFIYCFPRKIFIRWKDAKYVYPLIVMFLPMIFFWAMFDMKGSKWVLTGTQVGKHNLCRISYMRIKKSFERPMVGLVAMRLRSSQIRFNLPTRLWFFYFCHCLPKWFILYWKSVT